MEVGMRRNVWIANDSGYMTFKNRKAFFETTVDKYKRKSTLWIDRYGYTFTLLSVFDVRCLVSSAWDPR